MELSVRKISDRLKEVIVNPKVFWTEQKHADRNPWELFLGLFFPLVLLASTAVFLGEFFGNSHLYLGFAIFKTLREIILFLLQYAFAVVFINETLRLFGGMKNVQMVQKLVIYSMVPFLLVSIVTGLFPFLYALDILGFYGAYIFWMGVREILQLPEPKKNNFVLTNLLVIFFVFGLLSIILSKLVIAYI